MQKFSGWKIAGALCAIYFLSVGVVFYGYAAILPPMIMDLGWSRGDASIGYAILSVVIGLSAPIAAACLKRIGARNTIIMGGALSATGTVVTYFTHSLLQYYIGVGVFIGMGLSFQSLVPGGQVLANWFARRRALTMGMFLATGGLGAFIAAPGIAYLTKTTGDWRAAWLVIGAAALLASLVSYLFVTNHPRDIGEHQDGIDSGAPAVATATPPKRKSRVYQTSDEWTAANAVRTAAFWIIIVASIFGGMGLAINTSQSVIYLQQDRGIDPLIAGSALGTVGLLNAVGRLGSGWISDHFDPRYLLAGGLAIELIGVILLNYVDTVALVYIYASFLGLGFGLSYVALPTLIANYFGARDYAKLIGISHLIIVPMGAISSAGAGYAYDQLHSYSAIFLGFAALCIAPVVMALLMRPPASRINPRS